MAKRKFKVGQTLEAIDRFHGFEKVTIFKIDDKLYHCRIMNGITTIPIEAMESNYHKVTKK